TSRGPVLGTKVGRLFRVLFTTKPAFQAADEIVRHGLYPPSNGTRSVPTTLDEGGYRPERIAGEANKKSPFRIERERGVHGARSYLSRPDRVGGSTSISLAEDRLLWLQRA